MAGVKVNVLSPGWESHDCAIVALHCYLGTPYPDLVRLAVRYDAKEGRDGLYMTTMCAIAEDVGHTMRKTKLHDASYGIITVPGHAAVVRERLVMDRDQVYTVKHWLRRFPRRPVWVLTAEE